MGLMSIEFLIRSDYLNEFDKLYYFVARPNSIVKPTLKKFWERYGMTGRNALTEEDNLKIKELDNLVENTNSLLKEGLTDTNRKKFAEIYFKATKICLGEEQMESQRKRLEKDFLGTF